MVLSETLSDQYAESEAVYMKKVIMILMCLLLVLTIFYPVCSIIAAFFGYDLKLFSVTAFAAVLAALSACITILTVIAKGAPENKAMHILSAVITPLSLINAAFCIFECPQIPVIAGVLFSAGCCFFLTIRYGKPFSLKITASVLSAIMILPIAFFGFFALIFGDVGQNTVVKTVESPSGRYYARVIDSDQGALGGDTLVDVYQDCGADMLLFKIEKRPQRIFSGDWGEYENMQIYWKNDNCLIINSVEYEIR